MRLARLDTSQVEVVLARRNLLSLLLKLYTKGSARTLASNDQGALLVVRSESDDEHYGNRPHPPGPTTTHAASALQVAIDLIEQVADSYPDEFRANALAKLATQVAYQRDAVDDQVRVI